RPRKPVARSCVLLPSRIGAVQPGRSRTLTVMSGRLPTTPAGPLPTTGRSASDQRRGARSRTRTIRTSGVPPTCQSVMEPHPRSVAFDSGVARRHGSRPNAEADSPVVDSAPTRESGRAVGLDGIRGLAALYVVVHHCWLVTFHGYPANTGPAWLG